MTVDSIKNIKLYFVCLGLSIVLIFLFFRPLNSPRYRIIVADGLGYYAYLPAQFIYHDTELKFEWFDEVFNKHYDNHVFEKPTQNFMVAYGERMINLYYPGQSLLQLPFFFIGHVGALLTDYPADGFSLPYQLAMGFAALFYTLIGLWYCFKLLQNLSSHPKLAFAITLVVYFGSNLFSYSIFAGCYTHTYSFAFLTLALYASERFFTSSDNKIKYLLLLKFSTIVVLSLRPVNGILLLSVLYFFKPFSFKQIVDKKKWTAPSVVFACLILLVLAYSMKILYTQTHHLWANTYTIGQFYFNDWSHVWDNFFGFQNGIFWYTPLIMLSFLTLIDVKKNPKLLFLLVPIFFMILVYSFWFYWNIVNRTLVDFTGILAVLMLVLYQRLTDFPKLKKVFTVVSLLCVFVFQLKAYQLRNGILNNNYTNWKYYAKHYFTLHHVDVFPISPKTIIKQSDIYFDFESEMGSDITSKKSHNGKQAAILDQSCEYAATKTFSIPAFFKEEGFKKIRLSFWFYREPEINDVQLVFAFLRKDSTLLTLPFYINESTPAKQWDFKEFGCDLPDQIKSGDVFRIYFWNPGKKNACYIDEMKLDFVLKDGTDEINWK